MYYISGLNNPREHHAIAVDWNFISSSTLLRSSVRSDIMAQPLPSRSIRLRPELHLEQNIKPYEGSANSRALNERTGFDRAEGDISIIFNADPTTMLEELTYFDDMIASGKAEFMNGRSNDLCGGG
jgi:hypothetical protein